MKVSVSPLRRLRSPHTIVSLAVAGALLYFLIARFDVDLGATLERIQGGSPWMYLLAFVSYYLSFLVRGARWRLLAANAGVAREPGARLPSIPEFTLLTLLGWFANAIGWLRVGDAYRAYAFSQASRSSFSQALGIILAERVIDVVAIFGLLLLAALGLAIAQDVTPSPLFLLVALALVMAGLLGIALMAGFGGRLARRLPGRLAHGYEGFHRGTLGSLRRQLPLVLLLSAGGWLLEATRLFLVIQALGLSLDAPLVLFVALVNGILTTIPITPGGLGVVEPGIVGLLSLRLARESAISVAVLDRSISYASVVLLGAVAFGVWHTWLSRGRRAALGASDTPPS